MKVLVTGHDGYIGSVMMPFLAEAGHDVMADGHLPLRGLHDGPARQRRGPRCAWTSATRSASHLRGFDAVIHLAALSNDPLGNLDAANTYDINHRAAVGLAEAAKEAGVPRYLFASSCSLYGRRGRRDARRRTRHFNPVTPYGESEGARRARRREAARTTRSARPTLRNATAYGFSPRLRADVVVNNLVGYAHTDGRGAASRATGRPWRPLVHSPRHQPRLPRRARGAARPESTTRPSTSGAARRTIRCGARRHGEGARPRQPRPLRGGRRAGSPLLPGGLRKIAAALPASVRSGPVARGMDELYAPTGPRADAGGARRGPKYLRIQQIQKLKSEGRLDETLRWSARRGGTRVKVVLFCGGSGPAAARARREPAPSRWSRSGRGPIIWHVMKYYAHYGHKDFILCLGYRSDTIKNYFLTTTSASRTTSS
jgi:hypothetical protein